MKKLMPVLIALLGLGAGVGAGLALKPAPEPEVAASDCPPPAGGDAVHAEACPAGEDRVDAKNGSQALCTSPPG